MRRLALAAFLLVLCSLAAGTVYALSPLYTAWSIREAVKSDDEAYLAHRIVWQPVRRTLKDSLLTYTLGQDVMPVMAAAGASAGNRPRPSWWSRLKASYGRSVVENFVDHYATPSGLKRLFTYGQSIRRTILRRSDPEAGLSLTERIAAAWARVERAQFVSLVRFEIDMRDAYDPLRLYAGVLEWNWQAGGWRLVELHVRRLPGGDGLQRAGTVSAPA